MRVVRDFRPGVLQATPGRSFFGGVMLAIWFASSAFAQTPRVGGTAVIAGGADLQSLNSIVNTEAWTKEFIDNALFLRLVTLNRDLTYAPQLAQSWRWIGDTAVVFNIRRDVRWHDGRRTSAHDVAFTFERVKNEETASPHVEQFAQWQRAQIVDSFTIRFTFKPHIAIRKPVNLVGPDFKLWDSRLSGERQRNVESHQVEHCQIEYCQQAESPGEGRAVTKSHICCLHLSPSK
jgi:ABC-type transport system substrate-binding protein